MVTQAPSRLNRTFGNRHTLYLRSDLVGDSKFPFSPGDELTIRVDGKRLIVEAD